MGSVKNLVLAGAVALCVPIPAGAEGITIPAGTSMELILQDGLSTRTAKVGDTFRSTVVSPIDIDDQPVLPDGTVVIGKVELLKSPRDGHPTGVIGVKFTHIQIPGAQERAIEGVLTSWRQDDRRRLVELAPLVGTGRRIDTVFVGQSSAGRASTLVGDDLAEGYSSSGLGSPLVSISAGTQITMELAEPLEELTVLKRTAQHPKVRHIRVARGSVAAAQQALSQRGYYRGEIDGLLGSVYGATRQAIIRFQIDEQQVPTGDLDEETLRRLALPRVVE